MPPESDVRFAKEARANNFKVAKEISYDFSKEFKNCSPREDGFI